MADAKATFAIDLEDGTSGAADSAAKALGRLRDQIDGDTKALAQMQTAMKRIQGGAVVNIQVHKALSEKIAAQKAKIAEAQAAYVGLGGSFDKIKGKGEATKSFLQKLTEAAKGAPGPVQGVVGRLTSLRGILGAGALALGLVAVAAGLAAVGLAAIAASVGLLKFGIASADARRNELLHLEGLTKLRNWYGLAAGSAKEMQGSIDKVASATPLARDQLARMTDQLYRMGLRGENLSVALEGAAIKTAAQGDAAGSAFMGWAAGAAMAGGSVKKLTDDVKARLGGIVARQMLSLDVQTRKWHESLAALFNGVNLEPFLKGLNTVTSLFSQSTASGRALKVMLTTVFQPVIDASETAGLYIKRFFQGMVIGALTVGIVLLRVRNWFRKTFGDSEILKGIDTQKAAVYAGVAAVGALGVALVGAAAVALALALSLGAAAAAIVALGAVVGGVAYLTIASWKLVAGAFTWLGEAAAKAWLVVSEIDWAGLGRNIALGIRDGIVGGSKWVVEAIGNLGDKAWVTFKTKLGIASPSKKFAQLGVALPQGVESGVRAGTPGAQQAVDDMIRMPALTLPASAAGAGEQGAAPAAPSVSVTVGDIYVQSDSKKPQQVAVDIRDRLVELLEHAMVQVAAPRVAG